MAQAADSLPFIGLKVKEASGGEVIFRVKATTLMKKVMDAYCGRKATDADAVLFLFDGHRVAPTDTPEGLGMEDGDTMDVVFHQLGGGGGGGGGGGDGGSDAQR